MRTWIFTIARGHVLTRLGHPAARQWGRRLRQPGGSGARDGVVMSERILIGYDDSPDAVRAIEAAALIVPPPR